MVILYCSNCQNSLFCMILGLSWQQGNSAWHVDGVNETAGRFTFRYCCSSLVSSRICWLAHWYEAETSSSSSYWNSWGSSLAHSFYESLAEFMCNFLWQVHQLFCGHQHTFWKLEPCRQWHTKMSPSEKQMGSTLSLQVSAHTYPPVFHIYLPIPKTVLIDFTTSNRRFNQLPLSCED